MGRRGPAPTPTKLKLLRGETRPSRINRQEPIPRANMPDMPVDLSEEAAAIWQRVMAEYGPSGAITAADSDTLRCYCDAVVRYVETSAALQRTGYLVRNSDGDWVKSPLNQLVRDSADQVRAFARELGLSPSSRTAIRVEPGRAPANSRLDAFLARRTRAG